MKQTLTEIEKWTFLLHLETSIMDKTVGKEIEDFNNTIKQPALTNTMGHTTQEQNTFLSSAYETFSKIFHILGHKTIFDTFKKTPIIQIIFCTQMRLEINNKREIGKFTNRKKLNNTLNQRAKRKSQGKSENIWR